jgi:hypothetical protein
MCARIATTQVVEAAVACFQVTHLLAMDGVRNESAEFLAAALAILAGPVGATLGLAAAAVAPMVPGMATPPDRSRT